MTPALWTKPSKELPPLHAKVLVALKEDPCDPVDVACYTGLPEDEQGAWIGAGGRFYTRQIAGWMTVHGMAETAQTIRTLSAQVEALRGALPATIGRLHLGERLSSEHYCGGSHEMPNGQPVYWQEAIGEYPDDVEGYCMACAIEQAESDAGWCSTCLDAEHRASVAALTDGAPNGR